MTQTMVNLGEKEDRIVNTVKGIHGLKNKSDAINFVIGEYEKELEPELRPEFVERILSIEKKGKFRNYKTIEQLRKEIEHA